MNGGNGNKVGGAAPEEGVADCVEVEGAVTARQGASKEALEQVLQECEQDMSATDETLSDTRRVRERGEELAHQHVRHSLWNKAHWRLTVSCCSGVLMIRWRHCNGERLSMTRRGGYQTGVLPVRATQTVTQAARQGSRWALGHCVGKSYFFSETACQ